MPFYVVVGVCFGSLAALMASLITYTEYQHHFVDARRTLRIALEAGVVTFVFFALLTMAVGILLTRVLQTS